ncbi:Acyl-CoA dehydrogenase, C-terminal domain [Pseudonocardia thermophila]|uniref:Acyl-CoA dehydrogenase, C-terminal domain n=1 Tax=Pseudonocardia thermophila TaxID=1848 RepID=A0A1M6QBI0_PSETH|nr:acyl-CoA dehydrogenase family protein [Pseudonocardia thermophila]SHK17654.1 Acyl-CoA dehydrogenase, C-terminal domain [Pseudonocardia thermophila]
MVNGRTYWPSSAGWDERGVNADTLIVRTDPDKGGTEGLSALILERDTPGVTYRHVDKIGHRLASNAEIVFEDARITVANLLPGAVGHGDLVINRNFAWSGPIAEIAAVGMARAAYEMALEFARTNTAGALKPIIEFQNVGYVLGDVAAKIETGPTSRGGRPTTWTSTTSTPSWSGPWTRSRSPR